MRKTESYKIDLSRIIGVLFLATATVITLAIKCPAKTQLFVIYTIIGVGIALLLVKSADKSSVSYKQWNLKVVLVGGVALPFILFFADPVGKFEPDNCKVKQSVTVFVHGKKGKQDMILRQQGYVIMDLGAERKRASINENGEAYFQNLQIGDNVRLDIDFSEPFKSLYPDSLYNINEDGRIYLPVALQGIDRIKGIVLYNDEPVPGAAVKMDDLTAITDSTGNFLIAVPDSLQNKKYTVWFYKNGFKAISKDAYPQTGIPLSVVMEK